MRSVLRLILLLVATASSVQITLCSLHAQSPAASSSTATAGVFVLDDCDEAYEGKDRYEDHLTFVDAAGKVGFRVSGINGSQAVGCHHLIAADAARRCVWVSEMVGKCIKCYDLSGKVRLTIPLKGAGAIAVHPETGNLWALVSDDGTIYGSRVVVFDDQGQELITHEEVQGFDIVYDRTENAFWTVGKNVTKVFAADGLIDFSHRVAEWCAVSIDIDPQSGAAWIAVRDHPDVPGSRNQLVKFSRHGKPLATLELGKTDPFCVSVDLQTSDVWMVNLSQSIERFSSEGKPQLSLPLPALAILSGQGGVAWVVTETELQKLNAKGEALLKVDLVGKTGQAWLGTME